VIPPATRIVTSIEVDGREGSLTIFKGWEDTAFDMTVAVIGQDIPSRWRSALPKLLAAKTIYFTNDPGVFYNIKHVHAGALEMRLSSWGEAVLTFTCAPFKYQRNVAPVSMTASGAINNPGTVYSLPKITVYGTGTRTLTINGKAVVLNLLSAHLILDSELKTCYFGNTAQNNLMTGDFPVLEAGSNTITLGTGITRVEIEPRWRFL
jgi:phage-related protein